MLRWFCRPQFIEELESNLEELFHENLETYGPKVAKKKYWADVVKHVRPFFIQSPRLYQSQNQTAMWSNYLRIATRNFWKSRVISTINVLGLSLGLSACLIVFFHIRDELSYDKFLKDADQVYRVLNVYPSFDPPHWAGGPIPLGPALIDEFPGIADAVRLWRDYNPTLSLGEKVFKEKNLIFTDANFFKMISFQLSYGNPEAALAEPNAIVLTESMARKYFGDEDPMGKMVQYNGGRGKLELKVTGIMDDLPHNTHFQFDFLVSFLSVKTQLNNWGSFKPIWTYITLADNVRPEDIVAQLPDFAAKYTPSRVRNEEGFTFTLEPMSDIYMKSRAARNMKPLGDLQAIYIYGIVGLSILLIACINFVNLSMAKLLSRTREVGIRKTIGAGKGQLINQFMTESALTVMLSLLLAVVLVVIFLPVYSNVTDKLIEPGQLLTPEFVTVTVALLAVVSLSAGLYPALFISRLKPTAVLKRSTDKAGASLGIRKVFVVFQFLISAVLIIGILITRSQMQFIYSKLLGVDIENVMVVPYSGNEQVFVDELTARPEVLSLGISQRLPVNVMNYDGRTFHVEGLEEAVNAQSCVINRDFLETYNIQLVAGRNHFKEASKKWEFLINETAVKAFGWGTPEQAIGKEIYYDPEDSIQGEVIGVFKDYHLESLHEKIPPMLMFKNVYADRWTSWGNDFVSIKFQTDNLQDFMLEVEALWKTHNPDKAYFSLLIDDSFRELHKADRRFSTIFNYVTLIAMLIACLGLLGLSMLTVAQRAKEIGIRKALGASVANVSRLLSTSFMKLILVGLILASPIAYYVMEQWLNGFSYRIEIGVGQFLLAFLITTAISLITIGFQTVRAAMANPVKTLRDE